MAWHNGGERKREEKAKEVRRQGDQEGGTNEEGNVRGSLFLKRKKRNQESTRSHHKSMFGCG
jgi:hypothetical protein